jgi:hypothetical protein
MVTYVPKRTEVGGVTSRCFRNKKGDLDRLFLGCSQVMPLGFFDVTVVIEIRLKVNIAAQNIVD